MLVQASEVYTPSIFESFQIEYVRSIATCNKVLDGDYVFATTVGSLCGDPVFEDERTVVGNPLEQKATCSCGQFERVGLLCAHALEFSIWWTLNYCHHIIFESVGL